MLESIRELFATAPLLAWSIVALLVAAAAIAATWEHVRWWWTNTWMSFPVIGKIARYSKNISLEGGEGSWFKSEKALCSEYKPFIRAMSEHDYHEKSRYVVLAGDNGRNPMPAWLWPVIIAMVFVEAMGFSYVLAGFTIPGASENLQQAGAYGIAFLISIVLIFTTHYSGHQLYRNSRINQARQEWKETDRKNPLKTQTVSLRDPQDIDKNEKEYTRRINRIGSTTASYGMTYATAAFIVVIAIGATYVRGQVLEKMLIEETVGKTELSVSADGLNMEAEIVLPAADQAQDQAAEQKAADETTSTQRAGGWGTFIVLAFIFVALQALGVFFGFNWGFAGQNSKEAYKALGSGKFATYQELLDFYESYIDVAQSKLDDLHARLLERNAESGTHGIHPGTKTFREYLRENRQEQALDRSHQRQHAAQEKAAREDNRAEPQPQTPQALEPAHNEAPNSLAEAMKHIESLASKEEKMAYIGALPGALQAEVVEEMKAAKARSAKLQSELEELL